MIPFNVPPYIGKEDKYIKQAIDSRKICGDGQFTKKCNVKFEEMTGAKKALMTTSGTSNLKWRHCSLILSRVMRLLCLLTPLFQLQTLLY